MASRWVSALALESDMPIEDFNICDEHGVLPPEQIMVGGIRGGEPHCLHCGELLKSQEQIDAEQDEQSS